MQIALNILSLTSFYMCFALGLALVFGVMRVVNIAHGEFFMLGAVIAWYVAHSMGGHPALGFVAALVVAPLFVGAIAAALV